MSNTPRILILNAYGTNLGDQAILLGFLRRFVPAALNRGLDCQIEQEYIYSFDFDEQKVHEINGRYDLIVVGGGGIIFDRPGTSSPSGWGLRLPLELIDGLTVPLVVYAVGYNYLPFVDPRFPDHAARHVARTADKAAIFSVREHTSMQLVREEFGVTAPVDFAPDPAIYIEPVEVDIPGRDPRRPALGVCLRLDSLENRFPPPAQESYKTLVLQLGAACKALVDKLGFQIVFTPHSNYVRDRELAKFLKSLLPPHSWIDLFETFPEFFADPRADTPGRLAGVYRQLDVVLGKRMHSVLLPFSVGTAVVSVSSTQSNRWMLEELGCPQLHIDMLDFDAQIRSDVIAGRIVDAANEREKISRRFAQRKRELEAIGDRMHGRMLDLLF